MPELGNTNFEPVPFNSGEGGDLDCIGGVMMNLHARTYHKFKDITSPVVGYMYWWTMQKVFRCGDIKWYNVHEALSTKRNASAAKLWETPGQGKLWSFTRNLTYEISERCGPCSEESFKFAGFKKQEGLNSEHSGFVQSIDGLFWNENMPELDGMRESLAAMNNRVEGTMFEMMNMFNFTTAGPPQEIISIMDPSRVGNTGGSATASRNKDKKDLKSLIAKEFPDLCFGHTTNCE